MLEDQNLIGKWKIESMEMWGTDYINLVETGYFLFVDPKSRQFGMDEFVFGTVRGFLDSEFTENNRRVDFSWQGSSDTDEACGRGFFRLIDSDTAEGKIYIHCSDHSFIKLKRWDS